MTLTPQWLDELRARTTLSALIGRSIKVTKAGREFKACCPFHNEKTPSFTINDEKGFYHCFGCSAHGDAIRWMTDQRGLSFMDAVKELADAAGMQVPAADPKAAAKAERANTLYDVMAAAQDWFVAQFQGLEGAEARAYCERRGLKPETIKTFGIGFAPDSRGKLKEALKHFGDDKLVEAGLLISVEGKEPYDRFRGRLMIPIRDPRGRVIAFGGRILGAGEPKYLNSPDTPLFDKGRTLYNLDKASAASRASGRVIVVEGYMDAIALAQAGFDEAVAPLGTALTEQQITMLWRMVPKPLLCFDGDAAGQKAAFRAAQRALGGLKPGHSLEFVTLPEGQDPDDLVRSAGPRAFAELLDKSEPLVERIWKIELAAEPVATPEDRAGFKQRLGLHVANIADAEIRHHYADAFRERFDALFARSSPPQRQFSGKRGPWRPNAPPPLTADARAIGNQGSDILVREILAALLRDPSQILRHQEALTDFTPRDPGYARLLSAMLDSAMIGSGKETLDSTALLTILGDDLYNMAQALLQSGGTAFAFNRQSGSEELAGAKAFRQLDEAIRLMKQRPELEAALQRATELASTDLTEANYAEQQRLRQEKQEFDTRLAALLQREDVL
ncbi:DNA primase [Sphingorhabdus pulchriflava]|uniref:DNA primase n=1 Tax=Sphingorhabdus pulchriflava TaxID=2292257 RepID=A0A371BH17_9SPHN|nr:DNA primase [Sphingorhabdus pulchriflava]RDV06797.1 DNA primase [Sphingorhabdus pulchriflava]